MENYFWNDCEVSAKEHSEIENMTRLEANRKIVEILYHVVEKFPQWRFCQILQNLHIETPGCDNFYVESTDTLDSLNKNIINNIFSHL